MLAPTNRLILVFGGTAIPGALLALQPSFQPYGFSLVSLGLLVALFDAVLSLRKLDTVTVSAPELLRLWKDREGALLVTVAGAPAKTQIAVTTDPALGALHESVTLPEQGTILWRLLPQQRGRYQINDCALEAQSRLKLWAVRRRFPLAAEVRVYPIMPREPRASSFFERGRSGTHAQRQLGRGREFEKLREYAPGDGFDEIDWKATARRGRPITRVFQVERTQEVYIVLDASRLAARSVRSASNPGDTILERNLSAALQLALEAEKQGDRFGLITFSDRVHSFLRANTGKGHVGACREALYSLHARTVTPDFDDLFSFLRLRLTRRALLIFLTELDDPQIAESFARNVAIIRHKHLVLAAMLQPAGSHPLFNASEVQDADEIYDRLAGHLEWRKLRAFAQALKHGGVRFILFQPETVAAQLSSAYVNLKKRQAL